jgi:hypothetical protein
MKVDFDRVIDDARKDRLYGEVSFKFADGELVLITKTTTCRPAETPNSYVIPTKC